jgi:hypothetical protein
METKEAIDHLSAELKKDIGYWFAWQSNIAVAFVDELSKRGYKLPDQYDLANTAADNFLKILTANRGESEDEQSKA